MRNWICADAEKTCFFMKKEAPAVPELPALWGITVLNGLTVVRGRIRVGFCRNFIKGVGNLSRVS